MRFALAARKEHADVTLCIRERDAQTRELFLACRVGHRNARTTILSDSRNGSAIPVPWHLVGSESPSRSRTSLLDSHAFGI